MSAAEGGQGVPEVERPMSRPAASAMALSVRSYLAVRILVSAALAIILSLDLGFQYPFRSAALFAAGTTLFALVGVGQLVAVLRAHKRLQRVLWFTLPFDLIALFMLVYGTVGNEDPIYPIIVGLTLFYSSVTRTRSTWIVSGLAAVVYLTAHGTAHNLTPGNYLFLVFKGVSIVGIGYAAAWFVDRQAQREALLRSNRTKIAGLNSQLKKRLAELHAISEITEIIHSSLDFDQVGPLVMDVLLRAVDLPSCSLFVIDRAKAETLFSASKGLSQVPPRTPLRRGETLEDALASSSDQHFECTTLVEHNQMMVVFCAETEAMATMAEDDRIVLQAVGAELAVAIENSELYKLTKRLAVTDDLTGLHNYRYLQQRLDEEVDRARRYGKDLSLLMIDADDFKKLNDTYGHITGDRVLAEIGEVMRSVVREVDVVARYGGEEFSVILPETDAAGAFVAAEKVREAVEAHVFSDAEDTNRIRMTLSIGLATFPVHASDKETLLREADEAVYQAKRTGRNRVRSPRHEAPAAGESREA